MQNKIAIITLVASGKRTEGVNVNDYAKPIGNCNVDFVSTANYFGFPILFCYLHIMVVNFAL